MIAVSDTTKNLLKTGSRLSTSVGAEFEYNLNTMVEYISATSTAAAHPYTNAYSKLFPIDTIYKPFRPVSPGIKYNIYTTNDTDTPKDSFEPLRNIDMGTLPRLYYPGPDTTYKYWLAAKNANIDISLEYFSDKAKTIAKLIPTNKILARFETGHDTPTSWTISGVKEDSTTITASGTTLNSNGEAIIYYNGTTWSTTPPTTYTTTQKLKKITLTAANSNTGKLLGVIEFSPRWVIPVTSDVVSLSVNKETGADDNSILPVGTLTANYLSINIIRFHGATSRNIVEYNRDESIDDTKLYLFKNAIIRPYIKIGTESSLESIAQGTFFMSSWNLSEFGEAEITAQDSAKFLQDTLCPKLVVDNSPVTTIVKRILDSVGFSNYKIYVSKDSLDEVNDKSVPSLDYWWSEGDSTVWEVLQELCRDIQMNAFVDENNVLNFYTRDYIYNSSRSPVWTFTNKEITSGSPATVIYAPNIVSLNSKELFSANQVRVRYSTAYVNRNSESSQPLWKSEESFLGAGSLAQDIEANSQIFKLNPNTINSARTDVVLGNFNGYVLINGEVIEYDGIEYQYTPKGTSTPLTARIKNQSDIWNYTSLSEVGYKYFYPTGNYFIKRDETGVNIITRSLTSNVATLTTSDAHGFAVGAVVVIENLNSTFNGSYIITTVPTTTSFTYSKTASNVSSTSSSGKVYKLTGRAALGTSKPEVSHKKTTKDYLNEASPAVVGKFNKYTITLATEDVAKLSVGSSQLASQASTTETSVQKSFLTLSSKDLDKKTYDIAVKQFESIKTPASTGYLSCGTRMFFDSIYKGVSQVGGVAFCLDSTGKNGYYVLARTTAFSGLEKDIMIVKVQNNKLTVLKDSQVSATTKFVGVLQGSTYNIDVLVKREAAAGSTFKNTITVFINGFKIIATDSGSDSTGGYIAPTLITKNVGLHCGQGVVHFEYVYAKSISESNYNDRLSKGAYGYSGVYSDDTLLMLFGNNIYQQNELTNSTSQESGIFEFGTVAREIKKTKVYYDNAPAQPIKFSTGNNKFANVLGQRLQSFGAESYVINNTATIVPLDDSNFSSFYILGNRIQRSGPIDYDTDRSENSENMESVIFNSSWIQSESAAKSLAEWIKGTVLNKGRSLEISLFGNPLLSAGDIVSIRYPILGMTEAKEATQKYIITRCSIEYSNGLTTSVSCRAI